MQELFDWQHRLRPLLTPAAALSGLASRSREYLYSRGFLPSWKPPVPAVCVGGVNSLARGKVLVSAWLLGWAEARGLTASLLLPPGDGTPADMPFSVLPDTPASECGTEAALLARYRTGAVILVDDKPVRAAKSACKTIEPGILILHDFFSELSLKRSADILLLGPLDLDKGWNRPFPAGPWREGGHALKRAEAFVLFIWPDEVPLRKPLAERRLGSLGKPVFTVHPSIWRLRQPSGETAQDLGGEPYVLVTAESNQLIAAKAAQAFLKLPPRLRVTFTDSHRFTSQDQAQIAADASRMRAPHILATPDAALRLGEIPGKTLWTFDPDVVLGPCLLSGRQFLPWWEECWASMSAR